MSLYREAGARRRRRRARAVALALVATLVVLVVVLTAAGGDGPTHADRARDARAAATRALDGLELLGTEYPQGVRDGQVVAPTEYAAARADVARARAAVAGLSGDGAVQAARHALRRVAVAVDRRVAPDALAREVAAARARLAALSRSGAPAGS